MLVSLLVFILTVESIVFSVKISRLEKEVQVLKALLDGHLRSKQNFT